MFRFSTIFVAAVICLPLSLFAQQPEVFIGDNPWGEDPMAQAQNNEPDYLAKCLADPQDKESCFLAKSSKSSGGLESHVTGELEVVTYVPCEEKDGVCIDDETPKTLSTKEEPSSLHSVDITIEFDYDQAVIRDDQEAKLSQLATAMKNELNAGRQFAIIGHTDAKGNDTYNCKLSQKRAKAVNAKLQQLGLKPWRFMSIGVGEHVLKNAKSPEAAENRRVGFAGFKEPENSVLKEFSKLCR